MTSGPTISGATGLDTGLGRTASDANLAKAGKQFEAVFTGIMLKAMRQAKLADPLFDSKAIDTFSDMQDGQIAKAMADHAPIGIGKAMTDFLAKAQAANTTATASDTAAQSPAAADPPA